LVALWSRRIIETVEVIVEIKAVDEFDEKSSKYEYWDKGVAEFRLLTKAH